MPKSSSKTKDAPAEKSAPKAATKGSSEDRASRDLKTGQTLERAGKTKQAVFYYKDVVKKYPDTEAAKTAAERIKALEQD